MNYSLQLEINSCLLFSLDLSFQAILGDHSFLKENLSLEQTLFDL